MRPSLCPSTKLKRHSAPIRVSFWTYLLKAKLISWVIALSSLVQRQNVEEPFGVTDPQEDDAYSQWLSGMCLLRFREAVFPITFLSHAAGLQDGVQGMLQYQVCH